MNREAQLKKIQYQALHRGMKEIDIIFKIFCEKHLNKLSTPLLSDFEEVLKENDTDLYKWFFLNEPAPTHLNTQLVKKLLELKQCP